MSENRFKVPAKSPATPAPRKPSPRKTPPQKKASQNPVRKRAADLTKASTTKAKTKLVFEHRELPDVPDMATLTRRERMGRVLGEDQARKKEPAKKPQASSAGRYDSMRRSLEAKAPKTVRPTRERHVESKKSPDWLLPVIATAATLAIVLLIVLLVVRSRGGDDTQASSTIVIDRGLGARQAAMLFDGFVDPDELTAVLEAEGLSSSIQVGTYTVSPGMDANDIATMITRPQGVFKVWPGQDIADIDEALSSTGRAARGAFADAVEALADERGLSFSEGWFLAGDYAYSSPGALASDMLSSMLSLLKSEGEAVASSGLSLDEVVIIASMVNRETQDVDQMPIIAAVILNRLGLGMPLGIDATTRYELDEWSRALSAEDFESSSPYNTRRVPGLPPTGIGCPGIDAILAVLHPADTSALYYLHGSDGDLHLADDYAGHLDNQVRYR